jgi:hypothetical protein
LHHEKPGNLRIEAQKPERPGFCSDYLSEKKDLPHVGFGGGRMKKLALFIVSVFMVSLASGDMKNEDKPIKGKWDFSPQKVWEVDHAGEQMFENPSELRVSPSGTLYFHDFGLNVSYVFDSEGKFLKSFASQGEAPGKVNRYINCFLAGDKVVIGSPGKLHFYTKEGEFIESFKNNLFERFPLLFIDTYEFLYAPQSRGDQRKNKVEIVRCNLKTGEESLFGELSVVEGAKSASGGMPVVILGLTPQVKIGFDPDSRKIYCGRSDDYSIHIMEMNGKRLLTFDLEREKKAVSEEDKRKHLEQSGIPKDMIEKIIPALPNELTYFMRIQVVNGLIFVFSTESLERQQKRIALDIFSLEGKYLYRSNLIFADDSPLFTHVEKIAIRNDDLYALLEHASGKKGLVKYKISLPPSTF